MHCLCTRGDKYYAHNMFIASQAHEKLFFELILEVRKIPEENKATNRNDKSVLTNRRSKQLPRHDDFLT